jgi:hypothetical protein
MTSTFVEKLISYESFYLMNVFCTSVFLGCVSLLPTKNSIIIYTEK